MAADSHSSSLECMRLYGKLILGFLPCGSKNPAFFFLPILNLDAKIWVGGIEKERHPGSPLASLAQKGGFC